MAGIVDVLVENSIESIEISTTGSVGKGHIPVLFNCIIGIASHWETFNSAIIAEWSSTAWTVWCKVDRHQVGPVILRKTSSAGCDVVTITIDNSHLTDWDKQTAQWITALQFEGETESFRFSAQVSTSVNIPDQAGLHTGVGIAAGNDAGGACIILPGGNDWEFFDTWLEFDGYGVIEAV